jgi:hypothetical protein
MIFPTIFVFTLICFQIVCHMNVFTYRVQKDKQNSAQRTKDLVAKIPQTTGNEIRGSGRITIVRALLVTIVVRCTFYMTRVSSDIDVCHFRLYSHLLSNCMSHECIYLY